MSKHEDSWQRLDTEFDHFLLDMKPYVLKHPNRTERQRCAIWIKKLCDPVTCGSGLIDRRNRNLYARLLLHMLKRGVLEAPFTSKPEPGNLKTLPTYMAIYFGEPLSGQSLEHSNAGLPDWVTGELGGYTDDSLAVGLLKDRTSSTPIAAHHRYLSSVDAGLKSDMSPDDSDLEARLNSWNLGIENPRYLRENPIPLSPIFKSSFGKNSALADDQGLQPVQSKEIEMKIKVLEAKHQEEKLKMQQSHDADVEKILDRKNGEIEEMKSMYRAKQKESEEVIRKLEKKVQSVLRESQVICESKEKQIAELKKMSDQSTDSLKNEWEKKLHAAVTQMEQEKFELQKKHTVNIQELLEDTNLRLAKMEAEYIARSQATEKTVRELEMRVKHQSAEVEKGNALRQKVTQEKAQLEIQIASISAELQEANRRSGVVLHSQLDRSRESQRQQIQQADMALEQFKKQVQLSSEKAYTDMKLQMEKVEEDLMRSKAHRETQAKEFNQQLDALSQKYEQQMAEQRMQYEQERTRLQQQHSTEKDSLVQEHQREASNLERQARATLQQHQQHTQEWRKRDAQIISDLETQLSSLREELQGAHTQYKQQLSEMALFTEEEKQRSFQEKEASLDRLRSDMERIRSDLERRHHQEMIAAQEKLIAELQTSLCDSKEETVRLQQAMERQLEEANSRWDEERRTITHRADQAYKCLLSGYGNCIYAYIPDYITFNDAILFFMCKVTVVRQEYEEKIKGLMPAELRQELEDTITSLKAQVRPDCRTYSIWRPQPCDWIYS
uniref:Centrosomal protein 112 n=1 Tax=Mastacembelus armatus TaxID=205130 RepID=A0A7N8YAB5_9TELE